MRRADDLGRKCLGYVIGKFDAVTGFMLDEIEDLHRFIREAGLEGRYQKWLENGLQQRLLEGTRSWTSTGKKY